jgi:DNA-binding MarR family transcriptional regulator
MEKELSIDHQLRATWQTVAKMYNEQAESFDSTMAMAFVILNIDYINGTPSTALGPLMGMEATSLSRILKSMEEKGAIYREKNPNDGRGVLIKLTNLGKEKREDAKTSVLRFNEVVRQNVTKKELNSFFKVTKTINKLILKHKIFPKKEKVQKIAI